MSGRCPWAKKLAMEQAENNLRLHTGYEWVIVSWLSISLDIGGPLWLDPSFWSPLCWVWMWKSTLSQMSERVSSPTFSMCIHASLPTFISNFPLMTSPWMFFICWTSPPCSSIRSRGRLSLPLHLWHVAAVSYPPVFSSLLQCIRLFQWGCYR